MIIWLEMRLITMNQCSDSNKAAFEASVKRHYSGWIWRLRKDGEGKYIQYHTEWLWELWQMFSEVNE
jgi:hypothetical protein